MVDRSDLQFNPDYALPPGETLLETLETLGMSQAELADRAGRPRKTINEIIRGKAAITPETALQFERVLGVPASFWNNLERNYREALARQEEASRLQSESAWLNEIPYLSMVKLRWIKPVEDKIQRARVLLDFFGVASPEAWRQVWITPQASFRKPKAFESHAGALAAWLRMGEIHAQRTNCMPYSEKAFRQALFVIREFTREQPEVFVPKIRDICANTGVALVFIPELPGTRASGATRWLTPEKALLQLSLRYKTDDHLWFTLFHEAGHILLHGKKEVFLEGNGLDDAQEDQANQFAGDVLIPPERYSAFVRQNIFTLNSVECFADDLGIAPGIVVGRLQHDDFIQYNQLNGLKRHFVWTKPATAN